MNIHTDASNSLHTINFIRIVPKDCATYDMMVEWLQDNDYLFHIGTPIINPLNFEQTRTLVMPTIDNGDEKMTAFYLRWGHVVAK